MISAAELWLRMRKTTNLNDRSIFVVVGEAGTFSVAATHLQLPASTISRSLTRPEKNMHLLLALMTSIPVFDQRRQQEGAKDREETQQHA
jgi:hypothetical protein